MWTHLYAIVISSAKSWFNCENVNNRSVRRKWMTTCTVSYQTESSQKHKWKELKNRKLWEKQNVFGKIQAKIWMEAFSKSQRMVSIFKRACAMKMRMLGAWTLGLPFTQETLLCCVRKAGLYSLGPGKPISANRVQVYRWTHSGSWQERNCQF